jgi:Cu2+-exporting ATPase
MHPEVVSDRQADCPACGMALDPLYPLQQNNSQELRYIAKQLIWSAAFSFPLLIIAMSSMPSHVDIRLISVWQ